MTTRFFLSFGKQAKELVTGGKADGKPTSKFPAEQISMGKKVEREHTNNPAMAEEIAKDHLTEDKKYYSHLKEMEDKYVKTAFAVGFEKEAMSVGATPKFSGKTPSGLGMQPTAMAAAGGFTSPMAQTSFTPNKQAIGGMGMPMGKQKNFSDKSGVNPKVNFKPQANPGTGLALNKAPKNAFQKGMQMARIGVKKNPLLAAGAAGLGLGAMMFGRNKQQ